MALARKTLVLLALPTALVLVGLIWGLKIHAELAHGQSVFWLAELWAPAAVFTIVVVVCVDALTAAPRHSGAAAPAKRTLGRSGRPAKAGPKRNKPARRRGV